MNNNNNNLCTICIYMYVCIYVQMYVQKKSAGSRDRKRKREREREEKASSSFDPENQIAKNCQTKSPETRKRGFRGGFDVPGPNLPLSFFKKFSTCRADCPEKKIVLTKNVQICNNIELNTQVQAGGLNRIKKRGQKRLNRNAKNHKKKNIKKIKGQAKSEER